MLFIANQPTYALTLASMYKISDPLVPRYICYIHEINEKFQIPSRFVIITVTLKTYKFNLEDFPIDW